MIVRENTESLYFGCEFEQGKPETAEIIADIKRLNGKTVRPDSGITIKAISIFGTRRIVKYALEYARKHGRKKVTAVHKANILKYSDGLFLQVAREVAKEYADIEFEDRIVDNMCMQLVQKPELYDVMVLPNLYGDIVSDLCAGLVGGLGWRRGEHRGGGSCVRGNAWIGAQVQRFVQDEPYGTYSLRGVDARASGRSEGCTEARACSGGCDRRGQGRYVRLEARSQRSDGRGDARDGEGDHSRDGSRLIDSTGP